MSTSPAAHRTEFAPLQNDDTRDSPQYDPTERLDLLSDKSVRDVLDCLGEAPRAASDLADRLDASRATVYRRLDWLTDAGLAGGAVSIDADLPSRERADIICAYTNAKQPAGYLHIDLPAGSPVSNTMHASHLTVSAVLFQPTDLPVRQ